MALLEKCLGLPERQTQEPTHLIARQRAVTIALAGSSFEGTARQVAPPILEALGDVFRQLVMNCPLAYRLRASR